MTRTLIGVLVGGVVGFVLLLLWQNFLVAQFQGIVTQPDSASTNAILLMFSTLNLVIVPVLSGTLPGLGALSGGRSRTGGGLAALGALVVYFSAMVLPFVMMLNSPDTAEAASLSIVGQVANAWESINAGTAGVGEYVMILMVLFYLLQPMVIGFATATRNLGVYALGIVGSLFTPLLPVIIPYAVFRLIGSLGSLGGASSVEMSADEMRAAELKHAGDVAQHKATGGK